MNEKHFEAISAFFDGEPVDPDLLSESLAQPGAADLLSEFAAMRACVQQDSSRPETGFAEKVLARLKSAAASRRVMRYVEQAAIAASITFVAALAGFQLGSRGMDRAAVQATRPTNAVAKALDIHLKTPTREEARSAASAQPPAEPRRQDGPPPASLRLRFAEWRDVALPEETPRH